jgi:hypothetical protein
MPPVGGGQDEDITRAEADDRCDVIFQIMKVYLAKTAGLCPQELRFASLPYLGDRRNAVGGYDLPRNLEKLL